MTHIQRHLKFKSSSHDVFAGLIDIEAIPEWISNIKKAYLTSPAPQDIVCIKAGDEHDILEIYGDEDFELFWLYETGLDGGRLGHLHRSLEKAEEHPVPAKATPPDFPT